jgi:cytochrome c oxidase subunit III
MSDSSLHHQFADMEQQRETAHIGMWMFLITEVMFFGGMIAAYVYYRNMYPTGFEMASHSSHLMMGTLNTAVLLMSSLTMALAVHFSKIGKSRALVVFLAITLVLGAAFLGVKAVEYTHHFHDHHFPGPLFDWPGPHSQAVEMYFYLYFAMTGLHALHMLGGIVVVAYLIWQGNRGRYDAQYHTPVECVGLYWHFVDIVWIFLFPMFYLIGTRA